MSDTQLPGYYGADKRSLLELWLASIPCVASGCRPPVDAPLTPEEVERYEEYMQTRTGPASRGASRT